MCSSLHCVSLGTEAILFIAETVSTQCIDPSTQVGLVAAN